MMFRVRKKKTEKEEKGRFKTHMCIMKRLKWDGMHFLMKMHLHKKGGRGVRASEGPSKLDVHNVGPSIMDVVNVQNKVKLERRHSTTP